MVNWTVLPETFYNEDCSLNVSISETVTQKLQMDNTNVTIVDSTVQKVDTSVSFHKCILICLHQPICTDKQIILV